MWDIGEKIRTGDNQSTRSKTSVVATLTTNIPNGVAKCQDQVSDISEQATNRMSDGTVLGK
jgi:hypothetical protein